MVKSKCNHKKRLSVYARDKKNWISSLKIRGEMVYICEDCGEVFAEKIVKQEIVKSNHSPISSGEEGGQYVQRNDTDLPETPVGHKNNDVHYTKGEQDG